MSVDEVVSARPAGRGGKARPAGRGGKARPAGRGGKARPAGREGNAGRWRRAGFVALTVACVSVSVTHVTHATRRQAKEEAAAPATTAAIDPQQAAQAEKLLAQPSVVFRTMVPGEAGRLALAPLEAPDGPRLPTGLECRRVHVAAGNGLCLTDKGNLFTPSAIVFFGPDLEPRHRKSLTGIISRARVSPDGRYGAATVFVTGHSYAEEGSFSTQTTLYDMRTGKLLADLEDFEVFTNGERMESPDVNFWGVTFARQPGVFYATLGTRGHTYLVRGDMQTERMDVLRDGVECPSLSPDNTRIAFKQRVGSGGTFHWRPAVLDLVTVEDHPLAETRNVDDQIEWLDDDTLLYAVDNGRGAPSAWAAAADGTGEPRLFLSNAESPAVVRG